MGQKWEKYRTRYPLFTVPFPPFFRRSKIFPTTLYKSAHHTHQPKNGIYCHSPTLTATSSASADACTSSFTRPSGPPAPHPRQSPPGGKPPGPTTGLTILTIHSTTFIHPITNSFPAAPAAPHLLPPTCCIPPAPCPNTDQVLVQGAKVRKHWVLCLDKPVSGQKGGRCLCCHFLGPCWKRLLQWIPKLHMSTGIDLPLGVGVHGHASRERVE